MSQFNRFSYLNGATTMFDEDQLSGDSSVQSIQGGSYKDSELCPKVEYEIKNQAALSF
jgi:hypothetical protein